MTRAPATSFIIRLWTDEETAADETRGEVELIATGEKRLFFDYASLLALIESWHRDPKPAT